MIVHETTYARPLIQVEVQVDIVLVYTLYYPMVATLGTKWSPGSTNQLDLTQLWNIFYQFSTHSKRSDALLYSLTRKEAWTHYNRSTGLGNQMNIIELWTIMALRFLLKNRMLFSPVASQMSSIPSTQENKRILDIHGLEKPQFAWQIALDYPKAKIYGYQYNFKKVLYDLEDKSIGPPNFHTIIGESLTTLPFEDNYFDIVSTKSLWFFLQKNQWIDVFKEIKRVLKPGGTLEVCVSDFTIINSTSSDEYWDGKLVEGLTKRGIDPFPIASCPQRLADAGFEQIRRALLCIPRGWGGRLAHLTDFFSMYYSDYMFSIFGDLAEGEFDLYRTAVTGEIRRTHSATTMAVLYAVKPMH